LDMSDSSRSSPIGARRSSRYVAFTLEAPTNLGAHGAGAPCYGLAPAASPARLHRVNDNNLANPGLTIDAETPIELWRADRAVQHLTHASRRQTNGLFDEGCVSLNGQPCTEPWKHLVLGDCIQVVYEPSRRYKAHVKPPKHLGFHIEYEDADLMVVDKPASWLTVPSGHIDRDTLVQRIEEYVARQNRGRRTPLTAAHRLDRGVSGLLVFGKTVAACNELRQQFASRTPERRYVAIVKGVLAEDSGEIRSYLTTDDDLKRHSTDSPTTGELAITRFSVARRLSDTTLIRVQLETGRRNQIRVHFTEAGHPVLGDPRYGRPKNEHARWTAHRVALHAEFLAFAHPSDGRRMEFQRPLPAEFETFLRSEPDTGPAGP